MTLVPAAPPGPIAGMPGHFAHTEWTEGAIELLSLPLPAFAISTPNTQTFSTTSWVFWAGMTVPILNPHPTRLLRCLVHWQWQSTVTQTVCATVTTTGATVLGEGTRNEESREGTSTSTVTGGATRQVDLNPGTTNVLLGGKVIAAGSQPMSYGKLLVLPVGYV